MAELPQPYNAHAHIRSVLRSEEFRRPITRRLFDAYPERIRLLYVRIPRCAGSSVMETLRQKHPVMRLDLADRQFRDPAVLVTLLGTLMNNFGTTRTLVVEQRHIAPFLDPPPVAPPAEDPIHWHVPVGPCRTMDLAFAIVRPPEDLILSHVNGLLTVLQQPAAADEPALVADLRRKHAPLPPPHLAGGWKDLGRRLLAEVELRNPICTALGDGTAADALAQCGRSLIQLVPIHEYSEWSRSAFDCSPPDIVAASTQFLRMDDLSDAEKAQLHSLIAEDLQFYARFEAQRTALEMPYVKGSDL